jgi:hypothetical protein
MKGNFPKYPEYNALTNYHRRCLVATNYWRVIAGEKPISVPPEDTYYYKYFDPRCFEIRKKKVAELMGTKPPAKVAEAPAPEPAPVKTEPGYKPAPKAPSECTAHAPIPDGQGGFKCERCGTALKSKPAPAGPRPVVQADPSVKRSAAKPVEKKQEAKPEPKPIKPKQAELF